MRAISAALNFGFVFFLVWEDFDVAAFFDVVDVWLLLFCVVADSDEHTTATTINRDDLDQILTTSV
jgi:hypothetical protein